MGPTKVYHAQFTAPYSIRGRFGLSDTRNAVHGSGEFDGQLHILPAQCRVAYITCTVSGCIYYLHTVGLLILPAQCLVA
jgi:hypothetical protein